MHIRSFSIPGLSCTVVSSLDLDHRCILRLSSALGLGIKFLGYIGRSFVIGYVCITTAQTCISCKKVLNALTACDGDGRLTPTNSVCSVQYNYRRNQPLHVHTLLLQYIWLYSHWGTPLDSDFGAGDRPTNHAIDHHGAHTHAIVVKGFGLHTPPYPFSPKPPTRPFSLSLSLHPMSSTLPSSSLGI